MAQYAPQANVLSDELEYLQAYEDVLEKYKGRINGDWIIFEALGRRRNCVIAAWQFNKCQPAPPSLWWLAGLSVFIPAVEKWEYFLYDITFSLNFSIRDKGFITSFFIYFLSVDF